tara:strand:- start:134 stop:541 length:408 start_codon:yes stop_codon:yes gene_type:complete
MEITKERLKEIIIEELQDSINNEQLDEISPRTQYSRGGVSGIYDNAVDLMKMLKKHTESFNDPPDILDNMKVRLDLILGAAKQATAEYVAGSGLDRADSGSERARMRSQNLAFRGNGEEYGDGEFPEDMFAKYKE